MKKKVSSLGESLTGSSTSVSDKKRKDSSDTKRKGSSDSKRKSSSEAKTRASFGEKAKTKSSFNEAAPEPIASQPLTSQMIYLFVARDSDMIVYESHIEKNVKALKF